MQKPYQIVFVTVPEQSVADNITRLLLEKHLAACVSVVDGVQSSYWWEGKIHTSAEKMLMIKTKSSLLADVIYMVKTNHPYDTPEIISADISDGCEKYLDWVGANCTFKAKGLMPDTKLEAIKNSKKDKLK